MRLHPAKVNSPKTVTAFNKFVNIISGVKHLQILEMYLTPDTSLEIYCSKCEKVVNRTPKSFYKFPDCYCQRASNLSKKGVKKTRESLTKELQNISTLYPISTYINKYTDITFKCRACGQESTYIPHNVINGQKCRFCGDSIKDSIPFSESSKRLKNIALIPNRSYKGFTKKCLMFIKECRHTVYKSPKELLRYQYCNKCKKRKKVNPKKPAIVYIFKVEKPHIGYAYKVGVTSGSIDSRYNKEDLDYIKEVEIIESENRTEAYKIESYIKRRYKKFQYKGKPLLKDGNSELFKIRPKSI